MASNLPTRWGWQDLLAALAAKLDLLDRQATRFAND